MFPLLRHTLAAHRNLEPGSITGRKRIVSILQQFKESRELLGVTVHGCPAPASSVIVDLNESRNCFLLDELNLPEAHRAFLARRKAHVQGRLDGVAVHFSVHLLRTDTRDGVALYQAAIPVALESAQRRAHFRLPLAQELAVPVTVPRLAGKKVTGAATDLSAGGIGMLLRTSKVPARGQILADLSISVPESRPLLANIEVRFARLDNANRMLRLGARFVGLDTKQQRKLAMFLAEQQRKRRRFGPR
jgi:c-di-GMP-binding flagellar brake protein YcgR